MRKGGFVMPGRVKSMEAENRLRCPALKEKLLSAEDAAQLIEDGMTVAVSGFTPAGCPKAVPLALAEQVRSGGRRLKLTLLSGARVCAERTLRLLRPGPHRAHRGRGHHRGRRNRPDDGAGLFPGLDRPGGDCHCRAEPPPARRVGGLSRCVPHAGSSPP